MTRQYSDSIALAARRIVAASAVDITEPVAILPLAKQLMAETGCGIDAAKRHVAKAIRLARHETITSPTWGGRRTPTGGRPRKMMNLKQYAASKQRSVYDIAENVQRASTYGDPDSSLMDWLGNGDYDGNETIESIAAEWDDRPDDDSE